MVQWKKVIMTATVIAASIGGSLSWGARYNIAIHTEKTYEAGYYFISEPDHVLLGYTEFLRSSDLRFDIVHQVSYLSNHDITYYDEGGRGFPDGLVDMIGKRPWIGGGIPASLVLSRDLHYEQYPEEFERADQILRETKQRFKMIDFMPEMPLYEV